MSFNDKLKKIAAESVSTEQRTLNAVQALLDLAATKADTTDPRSLDDAHFILHGLAEMLHRGASDAREAKAQAAREASAERDEAERVKRIAQAKIMGVELPTERPAPPPAIEVTALKPLDASGNPFGFSE